MRRLAVLLLSSSALVSACGGSEPPPRVPKGEPEVPAPPPRPEPPPNTLWKEDVQATVKAGLGRFLQHVEVEGALDNGQFRGFRILRLEPPEFWQGVDLQPGDVVTSVNGMPIERDTQAYAAFKSLEQAKELRVSYLRGGEERVLVMKIVPLPKQPPPSPKPAQP